VVGCLLVAGKKEGCIKVKKMLGGIWRKVGGRKKREKKEKDGEKRMLRQRLVYQCGGGSKMSL